MSVATANSARRAFLSLFALWRKCDRVRLSWLRRFARIQTQMRDTETAPTAVTKRAQKRVPQELRADCLFPLLPLFFSSLASFFSFFFFFPSSGSTSHSPPPPTHTFTTMSEIDAALLEKMEEYNKKVEKIDLELGKYFIFISLFVNRFQSLNW